MKERRVRNATELGRVSICWRQIKFMAGFKDFREPQPNLYLLHAILELDLFKENFQDIESGRKHFVGNMLIIKIVKFGFQAFSVIVKAALHTSSIHVGKKVLKDLNLRDGKNLSARIEHFRFCTLTSTRAFKYT